MTESEIPVQPGIGDAKSHLSEYVNRVFYRGDRVRILKAKKPVAVLVSVEDAKLLEAIHARPTLLATVRQCVEADEKLAASRAAEAEAAESES